MTIPPEEGYENRAAADDFAPDDDSREYASAYAESETPEVDFEELTLAQLTGYLVRAPRDTWRRLVEVAQTPREMPTGMAPVPRIEVLPSPAEEDEIPVVNDDDEAGESIAGNLRDRIRANRRVAIQFSLFILAFIVTWWGTDILMNAPIRIESLALDRGAPLLIAGFIMWLVAEGYGSWPEIKGWWGRRNSLDNGNGADDAADSALASPAAETHDSWRQPPQVWTGIHPARVFAGVGGLFFTVLAWTNNAGNHFTTGGVIAWMLSIILWSLAFTPAGWSPGKALGRMNRSIIRNMRLRGNWTLVALLVIVLVGGYFRLYNLDGVPPEMTDDHVEKLLDAKRVVDGTTQIFFPNNGGREPLQMYLMAMFSQLPGQGINFHSLKLLAAIEGIITLPVMFWLGREMIGERDKRLGKVLGLALAAFVAVSYWHTAITRLSLRIVLMPLVTALLLIYLIRLMRHNRRTDFIMAGLVLGASFYVYQAARMLPVVVMAGWGLAFLFNGHGWRGRGRYIINLAVLIALAFVVFVPLFVYSIDESIDGPSHFWMRTFGRVLGDDLIQTTDEQGRIVYRDATPEERAEALNHNLATLADNFRGALLMFNWKGDVAWINAAPNYPEMDTLTGAFLIVGLAAWLARMIRRRDMADWLIPVALVIMLLPSALSIAMPQENPSATRASGAIPTAYLLAAFPLALIVMRVKRLSPGRSGTLVATTLSVFILGGAFLMNSNMYFNKYYESYLPPSKPYAQVGGILREFVGNGGGFGNAFLLGYPHWFSHRAIALEAGLGAEWTNGIDDPDGNGPLLPVDDLPRYMYEGTLRLNDNPFNPDKPILIFYSPEDIEAGERLQEIFPEGTVERVVATGGQIGDDFMVFRAPPIGTDQFMYFYLEQRPD